MADDSGAKLFRVVSERDRLDYSYDFGDNWVHQVTVEKALDAEPGTFTDAALIAFAWGVSPLRSVR